jgi:predicted nucleic acid-binding protein
VGSLNLSSYSTLYLDTSVYIYFFEDNAEFGDAAERILTTAIEQSLPVFASALLFTELLTLPFKIHHLDLMNLYLHLPFTIPSLHTIPLSTKIAMRAAQLRAQYNLRTPDAIHLATAIDQQADCFICADKKLRRVKEIKVLCLS